MIPNGKGINRWLTYKQYGLSDADVINVTLLELELLDVGLLDTQQVVPLGSG
jgi:hypothetical protein